MLTPLKRVVKWPLLMPLKARALRNRLAFEIRQHHYDELTIQVPLGHGLACPVVNQEHWYSFGEIFVEGEYGPALEEMPLPARWLDLGCHAGYFTLWMLWQRLRQNQNLDVQALLIDGDPRVAASVQRIIENHQLQGRLIFRHGAISASQGELSFAIRDYMASSVSCLGGASKTVVRVPILDARQLLQSLPPPYDLVKIDLEGSEFDFLQAYKPVLEQTPYLVMEWHSWHQGGGGAAQLIDLARAQGFEKIRDVLPAHPVRVGSDKGECGLWLLKHI